MRGGGYGSKSALSRVGKKLNGVARQYVTFEQYVSGTGHKNIKFDYDSVLRECLSAMGLLQKAERECVSICFVLGFAKVCSTKKRSDDLAGMKIINKDTKHPITKELMFNYEPTADSENGGGFHANEIKTCIPLHFIVGKELNEVFSNDLKPFFDFANKAISCGLEPRNENEKALESFNDGTFPMDMSAEKKCFDLGSGCSTKEFLY